MFSGALGLAAVSGVYLFVREAYTPRDGDKRGSAGAATLAALVAAALVALSPLHIVWSLQVRMYVLGTALTALSSWLLMRSLRREPPRTADWCLYTFTAILLSYTHHFGLFTLAAQYVFAAGHFWFRPRPDASGPGPLTRLKPLVLSATCLAFVWLFWLPTFLDQRETVIASFWTRPTSWQLIAETFEEMFGLSQRPFARGSLSILSGLAIAQGSMLVLLAVMLGRRSADGYVVLAAGLSVPTHRRSAASLTT